MIDGSTGGSVGNNLDDEFDEEEEQEDNELENPRVLEFEEEGGKGEGVEENGIGLGGHEDKIRTTIEAVVWAMPIAMMAMPAVAMMLALQVVAALVVVTLVLVVAVSALVVVMVVAAREAVAVWGLVQSSLTLLLAIVAVGREAEGHPVHSKLQSIMGEVVTRRRVGGCSKILWV